VKGEQGVQIIVQSNELASNVSSEALRFLETARLIHLNC
jgi:hypothetical protein